MLASKHCTSKISQQHAQFDSLFHTGTYTKASVNEQTEVWNDSRDGATLCH